MPRFCLILAALLLAPALARAEVLTAEEANARAARGALTIVDVRLPVEWAATGLPEGAEGVSLQDPATHEVRGDFVAAVLHALGGDKDRPIAVICARGNRSAFARDLLAEAGFTRVDDISEGMVGGPNGPGWLARGLPTAPCRSC
ncbi:MAG TPA: rhodanese-like domain-containing protein [Geminicoccaceae bacterium]|nr:rhodanese-like domain-containing protein [Geminicoccaceae bacterium]